MALSLAPALGCVSILAGVAWVDTVGGVGARAALGFTASRVMSGFLYPDGAISTLFVTVGDITVTFDVRH
jgi:hypothetical protein